MWICMGWEFDLVGDIVFHLTLPPPYPPFFLTRGRGTRRALIGLKGVYWQWVTCYLANRYVVEEISSALDANAIFLLALLIAMLRATLSHEHHNLLSESEVPDITLLDALVLLQLCYGYLFSVLSLFGYRTRLFGRAYISIVGTYIRLFLAGAISGYSVWFWFNGVEHLVQGECGSPVMFFFAKVHVLGGIKYFWKVVAIFCALYFCTVFLAGFLTFLVWVGALVYSAIVSKSGFRNEWSHFWDVTRSYATEEPKEAEGTKEYEILAPNFFFNSPFPFPRIGLILFPQGKTSFQLPEHHQSFLHLLVCPQHRAHDKLESHDGGNGGRGPERNRTAHPGPHRPRGLPASRLDHNQE
jgi:hypothetical protein